VRKATSLIPPQGKLPLHVPTVQDLGVLWGVFLPFCETRFAVGELDTPNTPQSTHPRQAPELRESPRSRWLLFLGDDLTDALDDEAA
jgi:hypothetical protein